MEIDAGNRLHAEIQNQYFILPNPQLAAYLNEVLAHLTPFAKRHNLPYEVFLLQDDRIYATSAPGGKIYITSGFIKLMDNEAQLASILAHEVAQLQYRLKDPKLKRVTEHGFALAASVGSLFLGPFAPVAFIGAQTATAVSNYDKTKAQRSLAADKQALLYLYESGYEPLEAVALLSRLMQLPPAEAAKVYNFNISHPLTEKRLEAMAIQARNLHESGRPFQINDDAYKREVIPLKQVS